MMGQQTDVSEPAEAREGHRRFRLRANERLAMGEKTEFIRLVLERN